MSAPFEMQPQAVQMHDQLVGIADRWLKRQNCGVTFRDPFRAATKYGEVPDAIGFRHSVSILVECKATRSDFLADKKKAFRVDPAKGMGDWRFFLCPGGLIAPDGLPAGWGLLYVTRARVEAAYGMPAGNVNWHSQAPFQGNKECECQLLYCATRRFVVRGLFDKIYEPIKE